jgi:dTDP-4-amino-4,6-dideoxygalactose transaminase
MPWKIPLSDLDFGPEELQAVHNVLASKWLSMGEVTETFERHFAAFLGVPYAVAVSSGTAALHLALAALGIGVGDEVIVPSLTFVASANAVLYIGATPVFVDITSTDDFSIAPQAIEQALTPATKAVMVVHYGGYPADMAAIATAIAGRDIAVVEDAAHAPGAQLDGRSLGSFGDAGCFSFFANKNMTTGEGGMLITPRQDVYERVRRLRSHGMTTVTWDRHRGHASSYDVVALGFNYRTSEINAALGITQLRKLPTNTQRRRQLTEQYHRRLRDIPGVAIPFQAHRGSSAYHLLPVLLENAVVRAHVMQHLASRGIQTSIHYPPIHQFSFYRKLQQVSPASLPKTEAVGSCQMTLPLYADLTEDQVAYVCDCVAEALQKL